LSGLEGKVVIVTGASRGIGAAAARVLAADGARVVLAARTATDLEAVASEAQAAGGEALVLPTDIADEESVKRLVGTVVARRSRGG